MTRSFCYFCISLSIFSCRESDRLIGSSAFSDNAETRFTKINPEHSTITFQNKIIQTEDFNYIQHEYIYNGAGVAVLDYDMDGLQDLYFVSTFGANKLYRNKGEFIFEDVTDTTRTVDDKGFSTGVSVLDVNNDGWPDLYVCKAGSLDDDNGRRNLLFVNQKDGTFREEAGKWGLDHPGYSTQAYLLDYDRDGDRDIYLVNYRYDFDNVATLSHIIQNQVEDISSDQLFRNDGTYFSNVTAEMGVMNKMWGLSAVISDFDNDGWEDLYVSNDFSEPDFLYINDKKGNFNNQTRSRFQHISFFSMGSDFADLDNDLEPDLITLDMASENYIRSKENMASMNTETFWEIVNIGYHHQYMANMLHKNIGAGIFSEIGQLSGISKTDWSWAPLIADLDNDGLKDIYITNGVEREYNNQDTQRKVKAIRASDISYKIDDILAMYPSDPLVNYTYRNMGDMKFENVSENWGLNDKTFSNGAAYADLDNDGDLDLISHNLNDFAGIYRNNSTNNYLDIHLKGPANNPLAIGSKVYLIDNKQSQVSELYLARGYMSSVSGIVHFGLGKENLAEKVVVKWPDGKISQLEQISANQKIIIDYKHALEKESGLPRKQWVKRVIDPTGLGISYKQVENEFDDYSLQLLLPQKQSSKGTGIIKADLNNDGLEDFFVGNAAGAPAALYLQSSDGTFRSNNEQLWKREAKFEDATALFFDADQDDDKDLYVVSAGYELGENNPLLQDRLYLNDGNGNFTKSSNSLPTMLTSGKAVAAADFDHDGDLDLFIGGNVVPGRYPSNPRSYLLINTNGQFKDILNEDHPLAKIGMISGAVFTDFDSDGDQDLLIAGEWMAPTIFINDKGLFTKADNLFGLEDTEGWWFSISTADFDKDGDEDYVLGNLGKNNKFHPTKEKPLFIYAKDFDNNGSYDVAMSKYNDGRLVPVRGKECSSEQNPFLLDKIKSYKEFASLEMNQIYGEDNLSDALKLKASMFESVYVENLGGGMFKIQELPVQAQLGPTLSTLIKDFNNDGNLDIMGIGNIYDAEVETIRYDSNFGYVLLGNGEGKFAYSSIHDPLVLIDSKNVVSIKIKELDHYIVVGNNAPLQLFTYAP